MYLTKHNSRRLHTEIEGRGIAELLFNPGYVTVKERLYTQILELLAESQSIWPPKILHLYYFPKLLGHHQLTTQHPNAQAYCVLW